MTTEFAYKMMEQNNNRAVIVKDWNGAKIVQFEAGTTDDLVRQLREWEPAFASYKKVRFFAGSKIANASETNGNVYEVEFSSAVQAIAYPFQKQQPADMNNTMFTLMMGMMKENNAAMMAMQEKVTTGQIALVQKEMEGLKKKKGEIEEFGDVILKLEPALSRWWGKGGAPVANAPIRGNGNGWATGTAPKNTLSFEEMKTKPENEQVDIFMTEFKTLQDKMNPVDATALLRLANSRPAEITRIVYALIEKPELIDTAVSLLSK